jgi:thiol-disulfide isomerase/thioredoxin
MNKILNLTIIALVIVTVSCCDEIPPTITPCQTNRVVLVEEFTGVSCVNCPTGTEKLEQLSSQNPGKVIVVAIHAGYFSTPSSSNNYHDLRSDDGLLLESLVLGPVSGYPSATINRKIFTGENQLPTNLTKWAGFISTEICNRPIAELSATSTYDPQDSMATVTVNMTPSTYFEGALEEDLAISIMITESNIIGFQKTPQGPDTNYVHKHVLRDVISSDYTGDILITKGNVLSPQQKVITDYKIPAEWNPDNCYIVAFIHYKGDSKKNVQQAIEIHLK